MIQLVINIMCSLFVGLSSAHALTLEESLKAFHKNPKAFYGRHVPKYDLQGRLIKKAPLKTNKSDKVSKIKMQYRNMYFGITPTEFRAPPSANDRASKIVDGGNPIDNIFDIESKGLREANLPASPWSGDYWPIYKGILGNRYLDDGFPYTNNWKDYFDYITKNNFFEIYKNNQSEVLEVLSTSEKYDLLTGDSDGGLTNSMWAQGREYFESDGKVEAWMGICHGWSAAAVMVARPTRSVQVMSFDGKTKLNFNPSEIKGLASYLWATTDFPVKLVGGRCNYKEVPKDGNGRPTAPECADTNPATWFITAVNQIGIARRGFVMDVTADYEVWNQPVYGYSVRYFNPQTQEPADQLREAVIARVDYKGDKFKKYRNPNATHMVGVQMAVRYVIEADANDNDSDSEESDNMATANYVFDLELDSGGKIIGGEWYQAEHPDFVWVPAEGAQALSPEDSQLDLSQWDGESVLPDAWMQVAKDASRKGHILNSITTKLLDRAK